MLRIGNPNETLALLTVLSFGALFGNVEKAEIHKNPLLARIEWAQRDGTFEQSFSFEIKLAVT